MQQLDGLVSPALANTQQTELHQTVGHQVVVEPDLLLTEHNKRQKTQKSVYLSSSTTVEPLTGSPSYLRSI